MENRVINAAILGAGTVGGGVYKLAQAMEEDIFHKTGARLVIKKMLVRNVNKERKGIPSEILTDDWNSIINDPEIDIIVELMGGTPKMSLDSAAIIFKNVLGLVCDPVAGLVEIPCAKRNVSGAINALCTADMVMAGVNSKIPFDDAVAAMYKVGTGLPEELRETALGGCAITPTGKALQEKVFGKKEN